MRSNGRDWLKVVYGPYLREDAARAVPSRIQIAVRQTPPELDLGAAGEDQRVRVTVVPSEGRQGWTLWLRDLAPGPARAPGSRVWWRVEPGTWQPLGGTRQCVAEGRGRVRLDVSLRLEGATDSPPRLRFVAEMA